MDSGPKQFECRKNRINSVLAPTIIAEPLRGRLSSPLSNAKQYEIIIELNAYFPGSIEEANASVLEAVTKIAADAESALRRNQQDLPSRSYVFAQLTGDEIKALVEEDGAQAVQRDATPFDSPSPGQKPVPHRGLRAIFRIWESMKIGPLTTKSIQTVKADAAQIAYNASGLDVVWAVLDSGVDKDHPHFAKYGNLKLTPPLKPKSFVGGLDPLTDAFGHGTHVAGIIAGEAADDSKPQAATQSVDESGSHQYHVHEVNGIKGMAPRCQLLSLRVLDDNGIGDATALIQAIEYIQQLNDYGRNIVVHGANISVGYPFEAQWYACGQTPVCREMDRLVRSGVVVVVAAGNTGHASMMVNVAGNVTGYAEAGQPMTINDPGNAELAITVGSTDREKPHLYGISYFSSKGPTGDGRRKPDVVAPGENIISAATGANVGKVNAGDTGGVPFQYVEDSGTSMAAPHVSGIIAGFLSIRREFIGRALEVRDLLCSSAMDLKRDKNMQGAGLVDLIRLIQSI